MSGKYFIIVPAALVLIFAIVGLFVPETLALGWHVGHGFSAELNGVKFKVPILYQAQSYRSPNPSLALMTTDGRIRSRLAQPSHLRFAAIAFVFYMSSKKSPEEIIDALGDTYIRGGYTLTGERLAHLADRQGKCREYSGPPLHSGRISLGDKNIWIACYFGNDALATFMGTPQAVDDFYDIIQTAQRAKGHN